MKAPRMLWAMPYLPWPTTSGGKLRQFHLLRCLADRGYRITLLAQSKTPLDDEARNQLAPLVERLIVLPRRPLKHPRTLTSVLFSRYPLLVCVNGFAPELEARFEALLDEHWDIVQIEHSYALEPYIAALARRGQAFVLSEHNLESGLSAATYQRLPPLLRPFAHIDRQRYRRWERTALANATEVIALTEGDAASFRAISGRSAHLVVNGADTRAAAGLQPDHASQRVLFVGNFEYAPNLEAVAFALDEIMPRVWQALPQARFAVCGYKLPPEWAQRWPDPRIEWRGFVADLRTVQRESSVFLAPLRQGGGSKLKVLEALAAGLALVSTAQGVSGLGVHDGEHYLAGESAAELAAATIDLLQSRDLAARVGAAGRRYVREHHSWEHAANQLEQVHQTLESCA
jgi:glycosyltransferase involved in cell wall biosynthesis